MGSTFDKMDPDQGVTIEEKGRVKKGSQSQSVLGMTRTDYMSKFNKTSLNFSQTSNYMANTQNSLLGGDLYKKRSQQVNS